MSDSQSKGSNFLLKVFAGCSTGAAIVPLVDPLLGPITGCAIGTVGVVTSSMIDAISSKIYKKEPDVKKT